MQLICVFFYRLAHACLFQTENCAFRRACKEKERRAFSIGKEGYSSVNDDAYHIHEPHEREKRDAQYAAEQ